MATRELKATVFYEAGELTYNFPFDYIKKRFVSIKYIDNFEADTLDAAENLEYGVDYTINDKVVTLKEAGDTSKYIYIYRSTPTEPIVDFSNSSFLTEENLDLSSLQQLHLNEEMSDYLILHKVPSGTLTEIRDAVESANNAADNAQQSAEDALNASEVAISNAQSINIRTFNSVEEMKASNTLKEGALAKTLGFYTAGDGGGADYLITDNIGEDEVDEASLITLQRNLYAKLIEQDCINVKWFGAKGDNTTDDSEAINKASEYQKRTALSYLGGYSLGATYYSSNTLYFPKGSYRIANTVTFYVGGGSVKGDSAVINADKTLLNAVLLKGIHEENGLYHFNNTWQFKGLRINCNRDGSLPNTTVGVQFGTDGETWKHHTNFTDVHIRGFSRAISWGSHTYNNTFINCILKDNKNCLYVPNDGSISDAYERIVFMGCTFCDSDNCAEVHGTGGGVFFVGCSFDYCYGNYFWLDDGAKAWFNQCWIEMNGSASSNNPVFKVTKGATGAATSVVLENSFIDSRGNGNYVNGVVYCDVPRDTQNPFGGFHMNNCQVGYFNADKFVVGGGQASFGKHFGYINGTHPKTWQEDVYTLANIPFVPYGLRQDQSDYYQVSLNDGVLKIKMINGSKPNEIFPYFVTPIKENEKIHFYCKLKGNEKITASGKFFTFVFGYGYIDPASGKLVSIYKQGEKRIESYLNNSVDTGNFVEIVNGLNFNVCRFTDMCPYPIMAYMYIWIGNSPAGYEISFSDFEFRRIV